MQFTEPSIDLYQVAPNLWAGCYPALPHSSPTRGLLHLKEMGILTTIDLMEDFESDSNFRTYRDYTLDAKALGINHMSFPIEDVWVPSIRQARAVLRAIDRSLLKGGTYIHCAGGVGRTGVVVGCWLLDQGLATPSSVDEEIAKLRRGCRKAHRFSPETWDQLKFIEGWPNAKAKERASRKSSSTQFRSFSLPD